LIGITPDFINFDYEDQERLIKELLESSGYSAKQYAPRALSVLISRSKNGLLRPEDWLRHSATPLEKVAGELYPIYQRTLRSHHAFDFDDLLIVPIELFQSYPDVLAKYRARFRYILVDEYQDTNRAQFRLVSELAKEHRNLCVVGDDDQSIYGWRGADLRNILDFESDFPETAVFRLEQNYRSTQNILKAAGSVVSRNVRRKRKTLWSDRESGEKLDILEVEDEREEAQKVVEKIRDEVFSQKRSFDQFVVLYRTNAQSRAIEDELRRAGISYTIVGSVRFYERKEVKDILAYCKAIANPKDALSLKRIVNFPIRGIGDSSLQKIEAWAKAKGVELFEALGRIDEIPDIPIRTSRNAKAFQGLILRYAELKHEISAGELVHAMVDEVGLLAMYKDDTSFEGQGRLENIRELLAAVHDYSKEADPPTLSGFLEQIALLTDMDTVDSKSRAVTLMTVHCAKGLEFPVVLVAGLEEGLFPLIRSAESEDELEEERRLFYVALTRAREKVYMLYARTRSLFNANALRFPSRFLGELDPQVLSLTREEAKRPFRHFAGSSAHSDGWRRRTEPDGEWEEERPRRRTGQQVSVPLRRGQRVEHEQYGIGHVVCVEGEGPRQTCLVRFADGLEKKFLMRFARLQRLD
jgi:DNA helicase-2/ATP-dependent DNA helicase PcrA